MFNNQIGILFDYYKRVTDNLITQLSLPPSTGFGNIYTNLGKLQNKGVELEVNALVLPAWAGLQWTLAMTASHTKHKILELPEIYINGGRRGFIVKINPSVLVDELGAKPVDCANAD